MNRTKTGYRPMFWRCWGCDKGLHDESDQEREAGERGWKICADEGCQYVGGAVCGTCLGENGEATSGGMTIILRVLDHIGDGAPRQNKLGGWRTCAQTG